MRYTVTLTVDVCDLAEDEDTPEGAAIAGYGIMRDPAVYPPILTVRDENEVETDVDLAEVEGWQ